MSGFGRRHKAHSCLVKLMNRVDKIVQGFRSLGITNIIRDTPLSVHSTWRIGGPADLLVEPENAEQVSDTIMLLVELQVPYVVIGNGSNLLFEDLGLRGVVVKIARYLSFVRIDDVNVSGEAGVPVCRLAMKVGKVGLTGIEHIVGIPGTLGGLVAMNGGSQRQSIGEVVIDVTVAKADGQLARIPLKDCDFCYRSSSFQKSKDVIIEVSMKLQSGDASDIHRKMLEILRNRRNKFPRHEPNCGSVFISDPAMYEEIGPPGKVIEEAGCKGWSVGGAQVSQKHANFIVNRGKAHSQDVISLIGKVRRKIHERVGVWLRCEVKHVTVSGEIVSIDQLI